MHQLSLSVIFTPEQVPLLRQFVDHWLSHGVDHFYMTSLQADSCNQVLLPYIERGQVTLLQIDRKGYLGIDGEIYAGHLKHVLKCEQSRWLGMLSPGDIWEEDLGAVAREKITSCVYFTHRKRVFIASGPWTPEELPRGYLFD